MLAQSKLADGKTAVILAKIYAIIQSFGQPVSEANERCN
jgi:hypothetical protein